MSNGLDAIDSVGVVLNTRLFSFLFCAALLVAAFALPSAASAFEVSNLKYTQSTLQASAHPEATLSFERKGGENEDIRDMVIDLPAGVFANPEAANPKCTDAQFNSNKCPATSQIGDVAITVKALGLLDMTINGAVYMLNPDPTQTATMGVALVPDKMCILFIFCAVPESIFLKTGTTLRTWGDQGLTAAAPGTTNKATIGIPLIFWTPTITADITINKVQFRFFARTGKYTTKRVCGGFLNLICNDVTTPPNGPYFFRQSAACMPKTINVTLVSHQNVTASKSVSYTPTGCNKVPNDANIVINPHSKKAGEPTSLDFTMTAPETDAEIQGTLPKLVDVEMPKGSGLNLAGLSDVVGCTEAQFTSSSCPAASIIGHADVFSKFLPGPTASQAGLSGNVYALGVGNEMPMAVELKGRGNTVVIFRGIMGTRGDAQGGGDSRVYSTFDQVPELPYGKLVMTINKNVYKNPQQCGAATVDANIYGFNGTPPTGLGPAINRSATYNVVDCAAEPETTITNGPPTVSSIVQPKFWFSSSIPAGATFQCRIDAEAFKPCASPFQAEPLMQGQHTFEVKALNGAAEDKTPAKYQFTTSISDFTVTPHITVSDTTARAHPDMSASVDIEGGNPRTVSLRLPNGFAASLSARDLCDLDDAVSGNCPASSRIGIGSVTAATFGGQSETAVGSGYLTTAPTAGDVAGIMATADFSFGRIVVVGGAYLVNNGWNQYLTLREVPQSVWSVFGDPSSNETQISVTNLTVELDGSTNELVTNPSLCYPSSWLSTGVDWEGNDAAVFDVPFEATDCGGTSFNPTVTQTLTNPVAGQESGVIAKVTLDHDDAGIVTMRVNEPPSLGPNMPAFGQSQDQCAPSAATDSGGQFDPSVCPPQARVGSMVINTPLLPYPLDGTVYLVEASPIPWLGVSFNKPGINVDLLGITSTPKVNPACNPLLTPGGCPTQISVVFNGIPDVPIEEVSLTLDGPPRTGFNGVQLSGKMLRVASATDRACVGSSPAKSFFDSYAGHPTVQAEQQITISGCAN